MLVASRRLLSLIAMVPALAALGVPTQALAEPAAHLDLRTSGQGRIVAAITDATAEESAEVVCENLDVEQRATCRASYVPGRVVTLRADPFGSSSFGSWSDDRCPEERVCTLVIERGDQTVVASFSPQRLIVSVSNNTLTPGALTSTPPGLTCERDALDGPGVTLDGVKQFCKGDFALSTKVKLNADGPEPAWGPSVIRDDCDTIVDADCSLTVHSTRQVALNFGGPLDWDVGEPGDVGVAFRVAKDGTGSGTVRSESLDCGGSCDATLDFGDRQTLVADAERGSRFVRWRGACAASPRCTLAVGPVTRVTAVFDSLGTSPENQASSKPSGTKSQQSKRGPRSQPRFVARVGRVAVRGARPRRVHFTISVNARSSIRAVLENARGRRVSSRTWAVRRGKRVLRLSVPRHARRGTYVLKITARDRAGDVKRFERRVHVRR